MTSLDRIGNIGNPGNVDIEHIKKEEKEEEEEEKVEDGALPPARLRHARLQRRPSPRPGENALNQWAKTVSPLKVLRNGACILASRYMPSLALKRWLLRLTGMRVGRNVAVGLFATFDIFFPELITIGAESIIGFDSVILCHEYLVDEWRIGPVVIGERVMIGANCTILPGVVIGDGAIVSACSLVNRDVPPGAVVGGVPIKLLRPDSAG